VTTIPIEITIVCVGSRWQLVVEGEVDLRTGRDIADVAAALARAGVAAADIDLSAVSFVDTAGWRAVGAARAALEASGAATSVLGGLATERLLGALSAASGSPEGPRPAAATGR